MKPGKGKIVIKTISTLTQYGSSAQNPEEIKEEGSLKKYVFECQKEDLNYIMNTLKYLYKNHSKMFAIKKSSSGVKVKALSKEAPILNVEDFKLITASFDNDQISKY